MKTVRFALTVVLTICAAAALAQTGAKNSFTKLQDLAGHWEGSVTTVPPIEAMKDMKMEVSLRVTSRGNALVHEMHEAGKPDDPAKYDHPVTMFYVDTDRVLLTHYCDAGNRPRMAAKASEDGKTMEFDLLDVDGGMSHGHMNHARFTFIDADHHIEEWTYMLPGDKAVRAYFDLKRTK